MNRQFIHNPFPYEPNNGSDPNSSPTRFQQAGASRQDQPFPGNGLLSQWKFSQNQYPPSNGNGHGYQPPPDLSQQETIEQPAIQHSQPRSSYYPAYAQQSYPAPGMQPPQPGLPRPPEQPAAQQSKKPQPPRNKKPKKKRRFPIWARVIVTILLLLIILIGSGAYYYYTTFAGPVSKITGQTVKRLKGDEAPRNNSGSDGSVLSGGRTNILLLGSDDDYKSVVINGGVLAQTDIVLTIDPATKSVGMLSIPRDALVNIPGHGIDKLDKAYLFGGGGANGAALSMATIHQNFGIYINNYAWVGLSGFVKVIDTIGGINIDVLHPITDDVYPDDTGKGATDPYALKRLYIPPGPQHLDGLHALEYVRSRHADLVGDFGRSARQQQVLDQLKSKLDNPGIINQLPQLAQDLSGFVKTGMQLTDVFKLMYFARGLDSSKITRVVLNGQYSRTVDSYPIPNESNQSVVILNCSQVLPLIAKMFALGDKALCNTGVSYKDNTLSAGLASSSQTPSPPSLSAVTASSSALSPPTWPALQGLSIGSSDWFGLHSLLDLLFLAVFESPNALQS